MSDFDPRSAAANAPAHPVPAVSDSSVPAAAGPMPPFAAPWDAEPKQSGFNFWAFLHSFRRRWLLGVGLGCLIASTLAALLWVFVPIKSEAKVLLQVFRENEEMLSISTFRPAAHPMDFEIKKQTQISMLRSPFVGQAALRQPGIGQLPLVRYKPWFGKRENPIAWLEKQLKVQSGEGSELIELSMKAPFSQRDDLVKLLNAVKDAYMREVVQSDQSEMRGKLDKLKSEQNKLGREVRDQLEQIAVLSKAYGSIDSDQVQVQLELAYQELGGLQRDRASLEQRWNEVYDAYILHQTRMAAVRGRDFADYKVEDILQSYPEYAALKTQEIELKNQVSLSGGRGGMLGGSAQMQQQLQLIRQQMEAFKMEHRDEAIARLMTLENMDTKLMEDEMRMLTTQLKSLDQRRRAIADQIKAVQVRISEMGEFNGELAVRQLDLASDQEMLKSIDQEVQALQLEMASRAQVRVLQDAIIPDTEGNWIVKYMQIVAAWCLSFLGTVLGVALWDMQHQRVNTSQEVSDSGDVRVIGSLPALNGRRVGGLLPASSGQRRLVEMTLMRSVDSIRTALLFARSNRPYEVIMVTSALGNEGKTTVASQLAVSFARSGRRTLLIDGDIRNPQQHVVLGMPMDKGLSEVLRSECTLDDMLKATSAENLWSLPAGYRDAYTDQVMASSVMTKLFTELRSRFDMIVIDTGPALTSPDAMLLGQHADATVVSVRRDVSRLPKVNEAIERLRGVGVAIAGVVLNGTGVDVRETEAKQLPPKKSNEPQLETAAAAATATAASAAASATAAADAAAEFDLGIDDQDLSSEDGGDERQA